MVNTVVLKADSRKAVTNGVKSQMGALVVHGTYTATGRRRWIVPLKSVCTRLGINYKLSGGKIRISGTTKSSASNTTAPTTEDRRTETTDSKEKIKIVIDAGHGGSDSGASGNGMAEKNLTLAIVLAAKDLLIMIADSRFTIRGQQIHIQAYLRERIWLIIEMQICSSVFISILQVLLHVEQKRCGAREEILQQRRMA